MASNTRVFTNVLFLICVLWASSGEGIVLEVSHLSPLNSIDVEEGDNIFLNCQGEGLSSDMSIIWQNSNNRTLTTAGRFSVEPKNLISRGDGSPNKQNALSISSAQGRDGGVYRCLVVQNTTVVKTVEVTVNVFTFPDTSPECSPSGSRTLFIGDSLSLRCESSPGYPTVNMTITSMNLEFRDEQWNTEVGTDGGIVRSLNFTGSLAHDGVIISCNITSNRFPLEKRSCIFGPITVHQKPLSLTQFLTTRLNSRTHFDPVVSTTAHSTILPTTVLPTDSQTVSQTAVTPTISSTVESVSAQESLVTAASVQILSESSMPSLLPSNTPQKPTGIHDNFSWYCATVLFTLMLFIIIVLLIKKNTSQVGVVGNSHPKQPRIIYVSAISPI